MMYQLKKIKRPPTEDAIYQEHILGGRFFANSDGIREDHHVILHTILLFMVFFLSGVTTVSAWDVRWSRSAAGQSKYLNKQGEENIWCTNAVPTPQKPYIEFVVSDYDDDHDPDVTKGNLFIFMNKDQQDYPIAAIQRRHDNKVDLLDAKKYGYLEYVDCYDSEPEYVRYRFWPTEEGFKNCRGIKYISCWDWDDNGGDYATRSFSSDQIIPSPLPNYLTSFPKQWVNNIYTYTYLFNGYDLTNCWSGWKDLQMKRGTTADKVVFSSSSVALSDVPGTCHYQINGVKYNLSQESFTTEIQIDPSKSLTFAYNSGVDYNESIKTGQSFLLYMRKQSSTFFNQSKELKLAPCPIPGGLNVQTDIWKKSVKLSWTNNLEGTDTNGKWFIYRKNPDGTVQQVGNVDLYTNTFSDPNDNDEINYNTEYVYSVCFQHDNWTDRSVPVPQIESTIKVNLIVALSAKLMAKGLDNAITLNWTFPMMPTVDYYNQHPKLVLQRSVDQTNWVTVKTYEHVDATNTQDSYSDMDIQSSCITYWYRVQTQVLGLTQNSELFSASTSGNSQVVNIHCSCGTYYGTTKVTWGAKQVGTTPARYYLYRRLVGTQEWSNIYTTEGTASTYFYDDNTASPGSYYDYQVIGYAPCQSSMDEDVSYVESSNQMGIGFSQTTGVVSGRISYGTGVAVEGVRVNIIKNADEESKNQFSSVRMNGLGDDLRWNICGATYADSTKVQTYFINKPFTLEMWVNPDDAIKSSETATTYATPTLIDLAGMIKLGLSTYNESKKNYEIQLIDGDGIHASGLTLPAKKWSNIALSTNGSGKWQIRIVERDSINSKEITAQAITSWPKEKNDGRDILFGAANNDNTSAYQGYVDDIRFYIAQLTDTQLQTSYDRILGGTEKNLRLYWPLDEGINYVFDFSRNNGVSNENHGQMDGLASSNTYVPDEKDLSLYGLTDSIGNYTIRGIPFSGEGTSYSIVPSYGIHAFSPSRNTRFISVNSLTNSSVDYEDISSFPVSGTIYYENTDYPVEGVNFYIDGIICNRDGKSIASNEKGEYNISVPIGEHVITVAKNGHTFVNAGRYPEDVDNVGIKALFESERKNLDFYDDTKVVVCGRVCGGNIERQKPVGFGLSVNNIGKATLQLTNKSYHLNVYKKIDGTTFSYESSQEDLEVPSTGEINSRTIRKGGTVEDTKNIFITTDSLTGEFSALLPPIMYTVSAIKINSNEEIDMSSYLGLIDASNPLQVLSDTLETDTGTKVFSYNQKNMFTYYSPSEFTVRDKSHADDALGEASCELTDVNGKETISDIYTIGEDGQVNYTYGGPIFLQQNNYNFLLKGFESYVNKDDSEHPVTTVVPLEGLVVTISNALSSTQKIAIEDGNNITAGSVLDLADNQLTLDSVGEATYSWTAGLPNITAPFTRPLSMEYELNGAQKQWSGNGMPGIIIGELPTGDNFVTAGPDKVDMIIRDPGGTSSSAYWEEGSQHVTTTTAGGAVTSNNEITTVTSLGYKAMVIHGTPGYGMISEAGSTVDLTVGLNININYSGTKGWSTTTTNTKRISTSAEPEYVGAQGDVYVGSATNILFGNANRVDFVRGAFNKISGIGVKSITTTGIDFGTVFNYTQNYIENVLLPNLKHMRNNMLQTVSPEIYSSYKNESNRPIYLTKLSATEDGFGSSNTDKTEWGNLASAVDELEGPSYKMVLPAVLEKSKVYQDSVLWINNQIANWENVMAENEKAKVDAITHRDKWLDSNYSFDSGTSIENSTSSESKETATHEWSVETLLVVGRESGHEINKTGVKLSLKTTTGGNAHGTVESETTNTVTTGYTLAENGDDDALSIDVFKAPDDYGAIFYTKGGQTCCPYEGEAVTKYYQPGRHTISAATMKIEDPHIAVDNAFATDIPSGGNARYTLSLTNNSEIAEDVYYNLLQLDENNENGAILSIDGARLTNSRIIKVPAGQTVVKTLMLAQSDLGVLDYKNIGLALTSQCQGDPTSTWETIADTVYINAQFVPSSSDVTLNLNFSTMNMFTGSSLHLTIKDFDRTYRNFKALRLQYKYSGDAEWTLAKEYVLDSKDKTTNNEMIPATGNIKLDLSMSNDAIYPDGNYVFRVLSVSQFGNEEILKSSEEWPLVKDLSRPTLLGLANPADGILSAGDDISVKFNEDIRSGALRKANNFIIKGVLNDARIAHEVGLKLNGAETPSASTEATINLANHSFSADMWLNHAGAGTIIAHGSNERAFELSIDAENKAVLTIDGKTFTSEKTIPVNKWVFLTFNYEKSSPANLFSALVADDAQSYRLFDHIEVPDYNGNGSLKLGKNLTGAIQQLSLWDASRENSIAQGEMYQQKSLATPNLIGYWKFDEGHGVKAVDGIRSRSMVLSNDNWYMNNVNKALALDGQNAIGLNLSEVAAMNDESYAVELWFKGEKQMNATLWSIGSETIGIGFNSESKLALITKGKETVLSATDYLDNAWHHLAINVSRTGSVIIYVDGNNISIIPQASMPALATDLMVIGANRYVDSILNKYQYRKYFKGAVDEVRIWKASLSGAYLKDNRYNRIDTANVVGLIAYYPFETKYLDSGNQVVTEFSLKNQCTNPGSALLATEIGSDIQASVNAPSLKTAPTVTNLDYHFTASEREVYINLDETANRLEGTTVNFVLRNIRDYNNNLCEPVMWSAYIRQNGLKWISNQYVTDKDDHSSQTFTAQIVNTTGKPEEWYLNNLPSWLSVDETQGSLDALATQTLTFKINGSVSLGTHDENIYLLGNNAIPEGLNLVVHVKANVPVWKVDHSEYEYSMNLTGVLEINGKHSDNDEDMVAAFDGNTCVGVASPIYVPTRDAYFVMMMIYGKEDLTDNANNLTFKAWEASTGIIYTGVTIDGNNTMSFDSNASLGNLDNPSLLATSTMIEQGLPIAKGWNWSSFYVNCSDAKISNVFKPILSAIDIVKSKDRFATNSGSSLIGSLEEIMPGQMYRIHSLSNEELFIGGQKIDVHNYKQTIKNGWNWLGNPTSYSISVNEAFANLNPQRDDIVKSRSQYAIYNGKIWEGTMETIEKGKGYLYRSGDDEIKPFIYPSESAVKAPMRRVSMKRTTPSIFPDVDLQTYPSNMTVLAQLYSNGVVIDTVEIAVMSADKMNECRSKEWGHNGYYYLTIQGDESGAPLDIVANVEGKVKKIASITYRDDAMLGSLSNPVRLQLDGITGIDMNSENHVRVIASINTGKCTIESDSMIAHVSVINMQGKEIFGSVVNSDQFEFAMNRSVDSAYIVIVTLSNGKTFTQKVIFK